MKRQLSFSIISRNQISSGRELRFLPLESHSGKFVTHQVHMMIENKQLPNGCIGKWSISVFCGAGSRLCIEEVLLLHSNSHWLGVKHCLFSVMC